MQVVIVDTPEEAGLVAAARVARVVERVGAGVVLGVATGSSPLGAYAELARRVAAGELDLSRASAFALDEYVGLAHEHPESYTDTIRRTVTEPLGLDPARVRVPNGAAADLDAEGRDFEAAIAAAGGVDVQLLGIGTNGHIGFNEPGSALTSRTHVVRLTERTRRDNSRFFDSIDEVPHHAITQGLGTILDSRAALLIATGEGKADAVAGVLEGPLTAMCPGSVLQLHPNATVIVDEAAAAQLRHADYYRAAAE